MGFSSTCRTSQSRTCATSPGGRQMSDALNAVTWKANSHLSSGFVIWICEIQSFKAGARFNLSTQERNT